ncbi:hypothetical protein M1384_03565 [Candidatus Parvarchaeota archaeon]|nr:hypothetical protein [Candidatus Parvarchaeota archaeon]
MSKYKGKPTIQGIKRTERMENINSRRSRITICLKHGNLGSCIILG